MIAADDFIIQINRNNGVSPHGGRFGFHIFEDGRGVLLDFPAATTSVCAELLIRLHKLLGEESWRVDDITLQ